MSDEVVETQETIDFARQVVKDAGSFLAEIDLKTRLKKCPAGSTRPSVMHQTAEKAILQQLRKKFPSHKFISGVFKPINPVKSSFTIWMCQMIHSGKSASKSTLDGQIIIFT